MNSSPISSRSPVLVVDDEELYLRALVSDFNRRGYEVTARRDLLGGESAYREMERKGPAPLLVVDLIQPGEKSGYLGGLDLLRRLRPSSPSQVMALTDSDAGWLTTSARSLGAGRIIKKPDLRRAEPEHLDKAMHAFLAEVAGEDVPAASPSPAGVGTENGVGLNPLLGALEELRQVRDRGSVLLLVMRLASELAARGILYEVEGDHLRGLGSFGLEEDGSAVREQVVPLDGDTLPGRAFWSARIQRVHRGSIAALRSSLPEPAPEEAVAIPIVGPAGVAAVIYADNGANGTQIQDLRSLAALVGTVSLALDKLTLAGT